MEHYKTVVMDYLQADRAVFVNTKCDIEVGGAASQKKSGQHCSCDAVAIDLRHRAVYLCDAAFESKLQPLIKKLSTWTKNWDSIETALQHECRVPAKWRVYIWLFVPKDLIEMLDAELEDLRNTSGSKFKVKVTVLEDVQPWRASCWSHC
jgi:hypothetical protein